MSNPLTTRIYTEWKYREIEAITLENEYVRVDILPGFGAKIYNLVDLKTGHNLLWHNPRRPLTPAPFGSNFDDWWSGGWDDIFPNGIATTVDGDARPYLGEVWSLRWLWDVIDEATNPVVHVWTDAVITPARVEKWIRLEPGKPCLQMTYQITHTGYEPFPYMFGIHPVLNVSPGTRILLPAGKVWVAESKGDLLGVAGNEYPWPRVVNGNQEAVDLSVVHGPELQSYAFSYAYDLSASWFAVNAPDDRPSFAMAFSPNVFRAVWLWLVYGGWRGFYHAAVEPWTSYPTDLVQAAQAGRARILRPGEQHRFSATAVVYHGQPDVRAVTLHGDIVDH